MSARIKDAKKTSHSPVGAGFDRDMMESGIRTFLEGLGSVVPPSVLKTTPRTVADAWARELLRGYHGSGEPLLTPLPEEGSSTLVAIRGIRFVSICRHHLLPFQGTAAVGYLPNRRLAGFSAVARLVDHLARRLQIQEDLSDQIVDRMERSLDPRGVGCLLEATHQCMTCREMSQADTRVSTLRVRGVFEREGTRRQELLSLLMAPAAPGGSKG